MLKTASGETEDTAGISEHLRAHYKAATSRAHARGLIYAPAGELTAALSFNELMKTYKCSTKTG